MVTAMMLHHEESRPSPAAQNALNLARSAPKRGAQTVMAQRVPGAARKALLQDRGNGSKHLRLGEVAPINCVPKTDFRVGREGTQPVRHIAGLLQPLLGARATGAGVQREGLVAADGDGSSDLDKETANDCDEQSGQRLRTGHP